MKIVFSCSGSQMFWFCLLILLWVALKSWCSWGRSWGGSPEVPLRPGRLAGFALSLGSDGWCGFVEVQLCESMCVASVLLKVGASQGVGDPKFASLNQIQPSVSFKNEFLFGKSWKQIFFCWGVWGFLFLTEKPRRWLDTASLCFSRVMSIPGHINVAEASVLQNILHVSDIKGYASDTRDLG